MVLKMARPSGGRVKRHIVASLAQHEKYLKRMIYIVTSLSKVKVLDTIMVFILVFPGKQ